MNWKKWLGIIVIVVVVLFVGYSVFSTDDQETAAAVRTGQVTTADIQETVPTTGTIEAVDSQEIYGQGPVSETNVEAGEEVSEGDQLASYAQSGPVTANINGTVTQVNIEEGEIDNNIQLGQPSILVEDLSNLQVSIGLSKSDADAVEVDQPVELTYLDETYSGTVSDIAPVATEEQSTSMAPSSDSSSTLNTSVTFDEQPENIVPGFNIDLDIIVDSSEDTTVMPIEALNYDEEGDTYVFTVENGTASQQEIQTGIQSSTTIEVTEGLSEGDELILSPSEEIEDGTEVEPESSAETEE